MILLAYPVHWCKQCTFFVEKNKLAVLPLCPIQSNKTFLQWDIDFIITINTPLSSSHKWVLTATNHFTRWIEPIMLKEVTNLVILEFLEGIVKRFNIPQSIIFDNAKLFLGIIIFNWALSLGICLNTFSNYYPQGNGTEKSNNKNPIRIMKWKMDIN